jgi:5-methylcytosine-specific restriction endonuclease McrA
MKRDQSLRRKTMKRDNFTCQKCKIEDKTGSNLEVHHIIPLCFDGEDNLDNSMTLCRDCHHFAPNEKEEFKEYMKDEMEGFSTKFIKIWKKLNKEKPELFKEIK